MLKGHQYVICMLPFNLVKGIADAANEMGVHYFDVTEDVATTDAVLRDPGERQGQGRPVPQCGLCRGTSPLRHMMSRASLIRSRT